MSGTSESDKLRLELGAWKYHLENWKSLAIDMLDNRERWPEERWDEFCIQSGVLLAMVPGASNRVRLIMAELADPKSAKSKATPELELAVFDCLLVVEQAIKALYAQRLHDQHFDRNQFFYRCRFSGIKDGEILAAAKQENEDWDCVMTIQNMRKCALSHQKSYCLPPIPSRREY